MLVTIGTVLSGMVAGLGSLEDSRHQVAGVMNTGCLMQGIDERSGIVVANQRFT